MKFIKHSPFFLLCVGLSASLHRVRCFSIEHPNDETLQFVGEEGRLLTYAAPPTSGGSGCSDSANGSFLFYRPRTTRDKCQWLQSQSQDVIDFNCRYPIISRNCAKSCGTCQSGRGRGRCDDKKRTFFFFHSSRVGCAWIRQDAERKKKFCQGSSPALRMCQRTCGVCTVTAPSTPTAAPTTFQPTACVNDYIINFSQNGNGEFLNPGDKIDDTVPFNAVTFTARKTGEGPSGDWDDGMIAIAQNPRLGKVLLISDGRGTQSPNRSGVGGEIVAEFTRPLTVVSLKVFGTRENGNRLVFFDANDTIIRVINVPKIRYGGYRYLRPYVPNTKKMKVFFAKSGAIDDIEIWRDCTGSPTMSPSLPSKAPPLGSSQPTQGPTDLPSPKPTTAPSGMPTFSPTTSQPTVCVSDYIIDFSQNGSGELLNLGDKIDNSVPFNAVTFTAKKFGVGRYAPRDDGMISIAQDPSLDKVLVVSDGRGAQSPNRNGVGGDIVAEFAHPVTVVSLKIFGARANGNRLIFFDSNNKIIRVMNIPKTPNGKYNHYRPYVPNTKKMRVLFKKSGAIDDIEIWRDCTSMPTASPSSPPKAPPLGSVQPTQVPRNAPSSTPTTAPTTTNPTDAPSFGPSRQPIAAPTATPTDEPSEEPTRLPSSQPTQAPSHTPSSKPTTAPTNPHPTDAPSFAPSRQPTAAPTNKPSEKPTGVPSKQPTQAPSSGPTSSPTSGPTSKPTAPPTAGPTSSPTRAPTAGPTSKPSVHPTTSPTLAPQEHPTSQPSSGPTIKHTNHPSNAPTTAPPTVAPTNNPTSEPTTDPATTPAPTICVPDYIIDFSVDGTGKQLLEGDTINDDVKFNAVTFKGRAFGSPNSVYNDAVVADAGAPKGNMVILTENSLAGEIIATFNREVTLVSLAIKIDDGDYSDVVLDFFDQTGALVKTVTDYTFVDKVIGARYVPYAEDILTMRVTFGRAGYSLDEVDVWRHCTMHPSSAPTLAPTTASPTLAPTTAAPTSLPTVSRSPSNAPTASTPKPTICAPDYIIGFGTTGEGDALNAGDLVNETVPFNAATFKARNDNGDFDDGMIYDAGVPNGDVLIISQDGINAIPGAGEIIVEFSREVTVVSVLIGGATDNATLFEFWDASDSAVGEGVTIPYLIEPGGVRYIPYIEDITKMRITFTTPGKFLAETDIWRDCTFEPTGAPVKTDLPTSAPTTSSPTLTPTSATPTHTPTTLSPTDAPTTFAPTISPTGVPTVCLNDYVIGFNTDGVNSPLMPGQVIDTSVPFNAVQFKARKAGDGDQAFDDGMLLDTGAPPAGSGLALIISEDRNSTHPVAAAGEIIAEFSREVTLVSLAIFNDSDTRIEFWDRHGNSVKNMTQSTFSEVAVERYVPYAENIVKMKVTFSNPGSALDEVDVWRHCTDYPTPVPKTSGPTRLPTLAPTSRPTTADPTLAPTSAEPTSKPTVSLEPTSVPTTSPTFRPTFAPTVCEEDYVLDFTNTGHGEPLRPGSPINETVAFNGVTFKGRLAGDTGDFDDAFIYDAGEPNSNVLVVSGDNDLSAGAGEIIATFTKPVTVVAIQIADDQDATVIEIWDDKDNLVRTVDTPVNFNSNNTLYYPYEWNVKRMKVTFGTPGAGLAEISIWHYCTTFAPTTAPTELPS